MLLKDITIYKYKSVEEAQSFNVDEKTTILVGMNESGKTSILEAIAKTNYFREEKKFKFNDSLDYPRKELVKMQRSTENPLAVRCTYYIDDDLFSKIETDIGQGILQSRDIVIDSFFDNSKSWVAVPVDIESFVKQKTKQFGIFSESLCNKVLSVFSEGNIDDVIEDYKDETKVEGLRKLKPYLENKWNWSNENILSEYITRIFLQSNLPKYLYYDEYYSLPARVSLEKIIDGSLEDKDSLKTAKALIELTQININKLINPEDFENLIAQLEATQLAITEELFAYWSTNTNLKIIFKIQLIPNRENNGIIEHILDIRVENTRSGVTLPLSNRSKGFNWFFSFLVWFNKIQEDRSSKYVLLLDEPGLNLHAKAQNDLLKFIDDLSENYQIIYTTHSPFMVNSEKLNKVRTVVEKDKGTYISSSIQEDDPNTLFPLQAALGYDIAQNLFISDKNLLVEGVSDLIYIQYFSRLLEKNKRKSLSPEITICPIGGLEKVSTFISLLRGSKIMKTVCLLDSSIEISSKQNIENVIREKLIQKGNVRFFDEFIDTHKKADIEDMFEKEEYITLFNNSFEEYNISLSELNDEIERIVLQINQNLGINRFNHYRPAHTLLSSKDNDYNFGEGTLLRFEQLFIKLNTLFDLA